MSLNCQSINAKFDEVQLFIDGINKSGSLGILCLQESCTDINEDISQFGLPGYILCTTRESNVASMVVCLYMYITVTKLSL